MSCRKITEKIKLNGGTLHLDVYITGMKKPVVVFVPGMGCYAGLYGEFLGLLAGRGFNVIGIDPPGLGRSGGHRGVFTFEEVISGISSAVSYAGEKFNSRIGILGSSLGGTYALYTALSDRRIMSAMCHGAMDISKDLHVPTRMPSIIKLLTMRLRGIARHFSFMPVPLKILVNWNHVVDGGRLRAEIKRDPLMVWYYSLGSWLSFLEYRPAGSLRELETPLKILVGENDRLFPPAHCGELAKNISPNGARVEVVPGGHFLLHESIPATLPVVVKWFEETLNAAEVLKI